jgi:hypothetical protein
LANTEYHMETNPTVIDAAAEFLGPSHGDAEGAIDEAVARYTEITPFGADGQGGAQPLVVDAVEPPVAGDRKRNPDTKVLSPAAKHDQPSPKPPMQWMSPVLITR